MVVDLISAPIVPQEAEEDDASDTPAAVGETYDEDDDEDEMEARDAFPDDTPIIDMAEFRMISRNDRAGGGSVATATEIATDLGSIMGMPKEAFLKSFTFYLPTNQNQKKEEEEEAEQTKENQDNALDNEEEEEQYDYEVERLLASFDINDNIELSEPVITKQRFRPKKSHLYIQSIGGIFAPSRIGEGDYLKSINGQPVDGSNRQKTLERMQTALYDQGFLSIITKSNTIHTDDILIHATVIKPRPDMTFAEMGMVVWIWGYLCIKSISKDSIFYHTALKETDHIVSINEIVCDRVGVKGLAEIITRLPHEITITVLRRKERVTGKFG